MAEGAQFECWIIYIGGSACVSLLLNEKMPDCDWAE